MLAPKSFANSTNPHTNSNAKLDRRLKDGGGQMCLGSSIVRVSDAFTNAAFTTTVVITTTATVITATTITTAAAALFVAISVATTRNRTRGWKRCISWVGAEIRMAIGIVYAVLTQGYTCRLLLRTQFIHLIVCIFIDKVSLKDVQ
jgi:hypothetical protein